MSRGCSAAPPQGDDPSPVIVTVSEIHLCCGACVKAVEKAAAVDGVQAEVNQDEGTAVLTAANYDDVQKALDEIAKAGFSRQDRRRHARPAKCSSPRSRRPTAT